MGRKRIIPILNMKNNVLVKGKKFRNHEYVGDVLNAVRIFGDWKIDELILLGIDENSNYPKNENVLKSVAALARMPITYGGGIGSIESAQKIIELGFERISIQSLFMKNPKIVEKIANILGSQALVISLDFDFSKKMRFGKNQKYAANSIFKLMQLAKEAENCGAGELLITDIKREGTGAGLDYDIHEFIAKELDIPIIAHGGATFTANIYDYINDSSVSAVGFGREFCFANDKSGVLLNIPTELQNRLGRYSQ